jgi:hypothetical protein
MGNMYRKKSSYLPFEEQTVSHDPFQNRTLFRSDTPSGSIYSYFPHDTQSLNKNYKRSFANVGQKKKIHNEIIILVKKKIIT